MNILAASEQEDCEAINCTILDNNDDVILLAAVASFMRRKLTSINRYFEVTIPAYLSGEFKKHFRMSMTWETCQLLTQEIMYTERIPTGNSSGRPAILSEKQILLFLRSVANREPYRRPLLLYQGSTEFTLGRETKPDISCEWNTKFLIIPDILSKRVHSKGILKFSKTSPGIFYVPFNFGPEISEFLVEWKAPEVVLFLEIWIFRKFLVPLGISTWYESAPVPLVVKSYQMAASLSSRHHTGCKMICHSSTLLLIAHSQRKRQDLISWKIVNWSFRLSRSSVRPVCILSREKSS